MKKTGVVFFCALMLTSCMKQEVPQDLQLLNNEVEEANVIMSQLDSASIISSFERVKPYYLHLSSSDFDSTLADIYIYDLTWLDRYQRAIFKWKGQARLNEAKLKESTSQVVQLIHDVENGLLDSSQIRIYTEQERLEIQSVIENIKSRGGEILYYADGVDSMFTRLDSIFPDIQ